MKTILIEDELNNLNLLSHFLKKYCPEVNLIATGHTKDEGVLLINKLKPDLLFLDIVLEESNAFELLEEIDDKNIKVIFVTAFEEFALKAFQEHAVDYLLKPIQIDELINAVKRVKNHDPTLAEEASNHPSKINPIKSDKKYVVNSNNTGNFNTTVGYQSMMINAGGEKNSAYGNSTLYENTSGSGNTAIGSESMKNNSTGNHNVGIGANTLTLSSNRSGGTAIGYNSQSNYFGLVSSLVSNTNTSIGFESLMGNTGTGIDNTAIGYQSMENNSSGYQNTVVGVNALSQNSSGYENSALGYQALQNNTLGFGNLALGNEALNSNTTGVHNVAIGHNSMKDNVNGNFNTAVGFNALLSSVAGDRGVAIGADSQFYSRSTTTSWINTNVSIGFASLKGSPDLDLNTGANNTAIGYNSMILNNQGSNNTSIGKDSLLKNTSGSNNVSIGVNTMEYNTTGEKNVAVGNYAGTYSASGDNLTVTGESVFVGYNTRPQAENQTNQIVIGYNARGAGSNTVTLGNSDIIEYNMYTNSWNNASDRRLKHGIRPLLYGLDFVNELNPVAYVMNNRSDEKQDYGFIAQEIQSLLETYGDTDSDLVKVLNKEKGTLGLKYNNFIPILAKAIQELSAENKKLKTENLKILERLRILEEKL